MHGSVYMTYSYTESTWSSSGWANLSTLDGVPYQPPQAQPRVVLHTAQGFIIPYEGVAALAQDLVHYGLQSGDIVTFKATGERDTYGRRIFAEVVPEPPQAPPTGTRGIKV